MKARKNRRVDAQVLFILALVAIAGSYLLRANFLTSTFLFLGLPSIYLLFRANVKKKEIFTATLVFGVLYCFLLDYLAELNGAWAWSPSTTVFHYKLFGVVTPDAIIWTTLWVFLLILFYEHMIDHGTQDKVSKKVRYVAIAGVCLVALVLILRHFELSQLHLTYAYFILGLCTLPPFIYVLYKKKSLIPKLLKSACYFVPLYLAYEIVGRSLGQWDFPGHYIGMIQIGTVTFPLEEFMFWIVLSNMVVLGGYEIFIDDGK